MAQWSLNIETEKVRECWEKKENYREGLGKAETERGSASERPKGHHGDKNKGERRETGREIE